MEDPPGSPTIKAEPQEHPDDAPALNTGEIINLISDNVDETAAPTNVRTLGSPFEERQQEDSVNLGPSMLSTKPKPAKPSEKDVRAKRERLQAMVAAKQRDTTQKHREAGQAAQAAQSTQRTPLVNRSELFVTESNPATPDPAEIFQALQREIEEKRQSGALTTVEEIEFMRAEADERERLYKKSLDANYDRSADEVSEGAPSESFAIPDLEDDDQYAAPKKGGRKRKAETSSKPQPKKRRAAREDAEDILDIARRKQAAKVKAKATKGKTKASEKKAPTKRAPKKKYTGPEMFNAENLLNGTDIFEAAARNIDMPDQPMHDPTGRKATALKQMIASMPQDSQKIASTDAKVLDKALKSFTGQGSCHPAPDGNWELKGLAVTLKSYQVLGVAFMRQREHSSVGPAGGILGDEMGLGKTVEMLANIINGKSLHTAKCHTTLIVASTALVGQWHREIRDKLVSRFEDKRNGVGRVKEYHAHAQIKGNEGLQELMDCDIVLTTYAQVNKEYPNAEIPPELVTAEQKLKWWKEYYEEHKGILFRAKFHRVVLDEAHVIKNHRSLTSRSCSALEAKFRWSISGTIVLNNLNEFFSQFRFLKVPYCDSYKLFRANFTDENDKDGMAKLRQFLNQFMIRRTHDDKLFDTKLLTLPAPKQDIHWVEFNSVERAVYDIVKARFVTRINGMARSGLKELDKQYSVIWAMLLRLRQLCSNILLIQGTMIDLLEREDFERLREISTEDLSEETEILLAHLREKMRDNTSAKNFETRDGNIAVTETETAPIDQTRFDPAGGDLGGSHGLTYNFGQYLESLRNSDAYEAICERTLCSGCRHPPRDPYVTACFHVYCALCLKDLQMSSARRGLNRHRCTECGVYYNDAKACQEILEPYVSANEIIANTSQEGFGIRSRAPKEKTEVENWIQMRGPVLPSAKTIALKARVLSWIEEDPDVKIIVFSQFLPMLRILAKVCQTENWTFEKYTGAMSHDSRENALQNFSNPKGGIRILLASLKCGGQGLNLVAASKVITLDPWWNASIEQQAFCRVYRIGQEKETQMERLVVKNSIDEAIISLQRAKQITIDAAIDPKKKEKVSTKELLRLFGRVGKDQDGKPFIFAQEDSNENRPPPRAADHASDDEGDGMVDDV